LVANDWNSEDGMIEEALEMKEWGLIW
jgi:hypothetical protein